MSEKVLKFPKRDFTAAKITQITSDWPIYSQSIDVDLRNGLTSLRNRCRHAAQNSDTVKAFLRQVKCNVLGAHGVGLQSRATLANGRPARRLRAALEASWKDWGRPGNCDVTGTLSWCDVQELVLESVARDGEAIVRLIPGWDNRHEFALQVIDAEQLDTAYTERLSESSAVIMGVEIDEWRRPVAYHLRTDNLIDYTGSYRRGERMRIPADEIIHIYLPEWVHQTRGIPWMHTAMKSEHHASQYEEAAVVAARLGASAMGHYKQDMDAEPITDGDGNLSEAAGAGAEGHELLREFEPGAIPILPQGWSFEGWNASFPNVDHWPFMKALLRRFASGTGVGYNDLAGDYEGVNFTSLRAAALRDRDQYKRLQRWLIDRLHSRVFAPWLQSTLSVGAIALPQSSAAAQSSLMDRLQAIRWQPRRWDWVDPLKDIKAAAEAVNLRTRSISSYIRERGDDPDEVWEELAEDMARLDALGLTPAQAIAAVAPPATEDDTTDE